MRSSRRLIVWLSVDCAIPSFAAAFVKLRSLATTRNHSRSLKSAFATGSPRREGQDLCSWSIDASDFPPLIISIAAATFLPDVHIARHRPPQHLVWLICRYRSHGKTRRRG